MELALWRWSTTVQLTSLVIVTLFFWTLARRLKLSIAWDGWRGPPLSLVAWTPAAGEGDVP